MKQEIKQLLLVDDSTLIVKRLTTTLYEILPQTQIISVLKGADAIKVMAANKPCLVVLDLQLPDMNGIEVLETIRRLYPATRVIVLTNHSVPYNRNICLKAGAAGFYDKTIEFEKAIEHIINT